MIAVEGLYDGEVIDIDAYMAELKKAMRELAVSVQSDFRLTTRNWDHKPGFPIKGPSVVGGDMVVTVIPSGPNAEIFGWVDQGTERHDITPRGPGYPMRFQAGYEPKTTSGTLWPNMGAVGKFGGWVSMYSVDHPGIEPREFSRRIAINHLDWWQNRVGRIIRKYAGQGQR